VSDEEYKIFGSNQTDKSVAPYGKSSTLKRRMQFFHVCKLALVYRVCQHIENIDYSHWRLVVAVKEWDGVHVAGKKAVENAADRVWRDKNRVV
jgi:hypothetical protein